LRIKSFRNFKIKEFSEDGKIGGHGVIFENRDSDLDIVDSTAFDKMAEKLASAPLPMLWQHNTSSPIGLWEKITKDLKGLFFDGRIISEIEKGREAIILVKNKVINGLSFGGLVKSSHFDKERQANILTEIELKEVSLVTFPANPLAVFSSKSKKEIAEFKRILEHTLRDAGLTKEEAMTVISSGVQSLFKSDCDDPDENSDLIKIMDEAIISSKIELLNYT